MIKKIKHIALLQKIELPTDQFALVGGCWFPVLNIRDNNDLDLLVSQCLKPTLHIYFGKLTTAEKKVVDNSGKRTAKYLKISNSKTTDEFLKKHCIEIDGYLITKFWIFHEYKKKRGRPKDKKDLKNISGFFRKKKHLSEEFSFLPKHHWTR